MYSRVNRRGLMKLGEAPDAVNMTLGPRGFPDWLPEENEAAAITDRDLIAINYYSPDSDYGPQRICNYDWPLEQHVTLDGVPTPLEFFYRVGIQQSAPVAVPSLMRLPAYERGFLGAVNAPRQIARFGPAVWKTFNRPQMRVPRF